jgi:hypothetical protein
MRFSAIAGSIVLALAFAACEQTPTAAPAESSPEAAFNFTNGPANPGAVVVRLEDTRLFAVFNDPDRQLLSVHGIDPDDFFLCGTGASGFGEIDRQVVDTPSEVESLTELFRAREANVAVYDTGEIPRTPTGFCTLFAGPLKIAEGPHDFLATTNDRGGSNFSRTFRFVGELEGVDGSTIRYTEVQTFVDGRGFVVEDIFLRATGGS